MPDIKKGMLTGTRVIVKVNKIKKLSETIIVQQNVLDQEQDSITEGTLVRLGPLSFLDQVNAEEPYWEQVPHPGDKVYFVKYAGKQISEHDGDGEEDDESIYRIIQDQDIYFFERKEEVDD